VAVALCGPAGLAAQLGHPPADHAALETCGAVLLALAKAFLEAGANLLLLVEAGPGQGIALSTDPAAWQTPPPGAPLVTSLGPVRGGFAACRAAVGKLTAVAEV